MNQSQLVLILGSSCHVVILCRLCFVYDKFQVYKHSVEQHIRRLSQQMSLPHAGAVRVGRPRRRGTNASVCCDVKLYAL